MRHFLHQFVKVEADHHRHLELDNVPWEHTAFVHFDGLASSTGVTRWLQERVLAHDDRLIASTMATPDQYHFLNTLPEDWNNTIAQHGEDLLVYSKHEDLLVPDDLTAFDWIITEYPAKFQQQFLIRQTTKGFERMEFVMGEGPKVILKPKMFLMENKKHTVRDEQQDL